MMINAKEEKQLSVRRSRGRSGHSLPTDCGVWDAHTLALTNTPVHPRRIQRINNKLEVTAYKMMCLFSFIHPREVIMDTFPCSSSRWHEHGYRRTTWTRLQTHNMNTVNISAAFVDVSYTVVWHATCTPVKAEEAASVEYKPWRKRQPWWLTVALRLS